jgi:16S rRNA (cytosine967-C5)-methyltransferase
MAEQRRLDPRVAAARMVHRVAFKGRSMDGPAGGSSAANTQMNAANADSNAKSAKNARLTTELAYGSIRHYFSLRSLIAQVLDEPYTKLDSLVLSLLVVGAYQLHHTRIPSYAAVNETVAAARKLNKPWARKLVNTVLRRLDGAALQLGDNAADDEEARYDHPAWLIDAIRDDYPDSWESILDANNQRAPQSLRVNCTQQSVEAYQARLEAAGLECAPGMARETLVLASPVSVSRLPGYAEGAVSVQDEGAQLATDLLAAQPGQRVLDACAAPGGKALHLLERCPDIEVLAIDANPGRVAVMQDECRRLGFDPGFVQSGDATQLDWWDGRPFDRILLDAPCSGSGTLRRHPDIKLLKNAADQDAFQAIQRKLLTTVWQTLAPDGILLYCTCSILSDENDSVIDAFVRTHPDAHSVPLDDVSWGMATRYGRQLVPSKGGPDGFYYARLVRRKVRQMADTQ